MMTRSELSRRGFLGLASGSLALSLRTAFADDDPRPPVTAPRATDGDEVHEPNWDERLTVTVGTDGRDADMVGRDDKVIQAALDYVARVGSGTVRLLPGTYTLRNAVVLPAQARLIGSGIDTVLTKPASQSVDLVDDSDWYDREITLADASGFKVGDGVVLRSKNPHNGSPLFIKRTLVARSGNRFRLDRGLRENVWVSGKPNCASLYPLLTSERTADVVIADLTLDGNRANNENFNGNYGGGIFLQDCNRYTIRNVTSRNYNGDGISFQICHDVVVENCHSHDNADLGVHPGSGSQRPLLRNNRLERNTIGLFWCWGVRYGLAEKNRIDGNRSYGISIGHHDTDNVMRHNEVLNSGKVGILFRDESRGKDFWANRNRVESNRIVNSGDDNGVAIDVQGKTRDLHISGNTLIENRAPSSRIGLRFSVESGAIALADNRIEGFAKDLVDLRAARS